MIGYLQGKLRHKSPDCIIIDVNGVGYCVQVPLSTFCELPEVDQTTVLNIHTHVREDTLQLYGFRTQAEKEMFLFLITVNGVGPRLAMNILSGIDPDSLRQLVLHQDHARLRKIPGVGKKIAERITLELRDKLKVKKDEVAVPAPASSGEDAYSDAFSALLNLGYRPAEAEKALGKARQHLGEDPPIEGLLKQALRLLA
jgi:holliday junction DNA helicase RuvA